MMKPFTENDPTSRGAAGELASLEDVHAAVGLPLPSGDRLPFEKDEVEASIASRFRSVVLQCPEQTAVVLGEQTVTYRELSCAVIRTAVNFEIRSPGSIRPVALCGDTSIAMIAAIFACFHLGRPFVFLDPSLPEDRIRRILEETGSEILALGPEQTGIAPFLETMAPAESGICRIALAKLSDTEGVETIDSPATPDSLAYIVFTSGSTGTPKGVPQTHRNVLADIQRQSQDLHIHLKDRFGLLFPLGSSAAICHLGGALLNGATLCPLDLRRANLSDLSRFLTRRAITILDINVSTFREFVRTLTPGENFPSLRLLSPGSEPLLRGDIELYSSRFSRFCFLQNAFGTSETRTVTQYFTHRELPLVHDGSHVSIGYPVEGKELLLMNGRGQQAEVGETGEMVVRSRFLPGSYWNPNEKQNSRFMRDTADPSYVFYHTGDLARRLPNGQFIHLDRKDHCVKIRGFLVDLLEIESSIREIPGIAEAAVIHYADSSGAPRTAAFIIEEAKGTLSGEQLVSKLRARIPAYMVPSTFRFIESLPVLINQKTDRRKLREMVESGPPASSLPVKSTEDRPGPEEDAAEVENWESRIAGFWKTVLGRDDFTKEDEFFDLGGDSLSALRLFAEIEVATGVPFRISDIFHSFTVAAMARAAVSKRVADVSGGVPGGEFIVPLNLGASEEVVIFLPGGWGGDAEVLLFAMIGRLMKPGRSQYAVRSGAEFLHELEHSQTAPITLEAHARRVFSEIGPLLGNGQSVTLIGECVASGVAAELSGILARSGMSLKKVILIDPWTPPTGIHRFFSSTEKFDLIPPAPIRSYYARVKKATFSRIPTDVHLLTSREATRLRQTLRFWRRLTSGTVYHHQLSGDHHSIIRDNSHEAVAVIEAILDS